MSLPSSDEPAACSACEESARARGNDQSFEPPDLDAWEVPIDCFRCGGSLTVPYKHVRSGAVLRCPACRGSYVVRTELYDRLSRTLPAIHRRLREECEALRQRGRAPSELLECWNRGLRQAAPALRELARGVLPAGAPRPRAGPFA